MRPEWKTWFRRSDGTPRVLYMTIDGRTELTLSETYDGCQLSVRLDDGKVALSKDFEREGGDVNAPDVQEWARTAAISYLDGLASQAARTAEALRTE